MAGEGDESDSCGGSGVIIESKGVPFWSEGFLSLA